MATEKNIAALLREDAKTIRVMFADFRVEGINGRFDEAVLPVIGEYAEQASREDPQYARAGQGKYKFYPYVTHYPVTVGDLVLVEAASELKVAKVMELDEEVKIEPGSQFALRWVVSIVDLSEHKANMEKNQQLEELVQNAYKANLRRSFRNQILAGLDENAAGNLTKLLGGA